MGTYAENAKAHAKRRLKERYNLYISDLNFEKLVSRVQQGKYIHLYNLSKTRRVVAVYYRDHTLIGVYSTENKVFITFFPYQRKHTVFYGLQQTWNSYNDWEKAVRAAHKSRSRRGGDMQGELGSIEIKRKLQESISV